MKGSWFRAASVSDGCRKADYIFLPAAGYRNDTSLNRAGSGGDYWSRTLNTSNPNNARGLGFDSSNVSTVYSSRGYGQSVRPVRAQ